MGLTDIISGLMEEHNKRKSSSENWDILKKKLKKNGYKENGAEYDEVMGEISLVGAYSFLQVWEALDKHINKDKHKWGGHRNLRIQTTKAIKELCKINNIEKVIEVVGETGYDALSTYSGDIFTYVHLSNENLQIFKNFAENDSYKKYSSVFKAIKKLSYKNIKSYDTSTLNQLDNLTEISKLEGDTIGAIYTLAANNYQIDQVVGISKIDIQNIKQIIEKSKEENSENEIPIYLYENKNPELFQEYFNNLEAGKKKSTLKSILDYDSKTEPEEPSKQNREWLEKNYASLIKEITFAN